MASSAVEENLSVSRIVASCSSCTYEFLLKSLPRVVDSTRQSTNPSDTEAIRSFISDAEEEVKRCKDEISRLQAIIDKVGKHQAKLSHEISVHQSSIAPIRRLPQELLALTFSFFCNVDFWDCEPFDSKKERMRGSLFREPFIIATVCNLWRSLAVSTPSLWSTIMISPVWLQELEPSRDDCTDDSASEVELYESHIWFQDVFEVALERSAQHRLKLWIARSNKRHWPSFLTTKLRQICSRIEQIHLSGGSDPFWERSESQRPVFDQLSVVRVRPDSSYMEHLPWLPTAPNLRLLVIDDSTLVESIWDDLPFQSTRFLFIDAGAGSYGYAIPRVIPKLSQFPNIISSGLIGKYSDGISFNPSHCVSPQSLHNFSVRMTCFDRQCNTDPKLGRLSYSERPCHCLRNLLSALTLPGLKGLQIIGVEENDRETRWSPDKSYFSAFIERSAITETLTTFSLHGIDALDDNELAKVLQSMSFLERLIVSAFRKKPIISTTMLQQLAATLLIPRLKILDIHIDITIEAANAVVHLVGARSPPKGNLEDIVLRMHSGMKELPETFLRLQDELKGFPGSRHLIADATGSSYLEFVDWID
ncbi:hypothetical protein C8J56DRAFT_1160490 [Mycena floridula]|nr:hypothetical protein C8J56DRAFT_1160490 [Mycena floridula]